MNTVVVEMVVECKELKEEDVKDKEVEVLVLDEELVEEFVIKVHLSWDS
jgi:hypothetical protein